MPRDPASHKEIIERLNYYAGSEALLRIGQITRLLQEQQNDEAAARLAELDAEIGGFGIHTLQERQRANERPYAIEDRPVYRPIQYVWMFLERSSDFEWHARHTAEMACAHIEGLIKRLAEKRNLLERLRSSPLGSLLHQRAVRKTIPEDLWQDLNWLNSAVYVHVKHNYSLRYMMDPDEVEEERKGHLFSTEEAIAIYIIARYLAVGVTRVT